MDVLKNAVMCLESDLAELTNGRARSVKEYELIGMVADAIKDLYEACKNRDEIEGYSQAGPYMRGNYSYRNNMGTSYASVDGNRYSNGMEHDGFYSGTMRRNYNGGYSGASNMSRGMDGYDHMDSRTDIVSKLEKMMAEAGTEYEKSALMDAINRING